MSARQTGLLCPLLHLRRPVGCSRAPSSRNCWKLCACRRWLRGAPPFLCAGVGRIRQKSVPFSLPSSPVPSSAQCGRKVLSGKFPISGASRGFVRTFSESVPQPLRPCPHTQALHCTRSIRFTIERRWKGAGFVRGRGRSKYFGPITDRQVRKGGVLWISANRRMGWFRLPNKFANG